MTEARRRLALALIVLWPVVLPVVQLGHIHPDELYQYLEPANLFAFGYGHMAWEWTEGIRNWAIPGLFGLLLKAMPVLNDNGYARRAVVALPMFALGFASASALLRLSQRRMRPEAAMAVVALVFFCGSTMNVLGRTMGEPISVLLLLFAAERLDGKRQYALAGVFMGLAFVARYSSAVFLAAAFVGLLAQRKWRELGAFSLAAAGVGLALLVLDWVTWGSPLHSVFAYFEYNLFSGNVVRDFGAQPLSFYLFVWKEIPAWCWVGLVLLARRKSDTPRWVWALGAPYLLAILATAHREERFMFPVLVLLLCAGAISFVAWVDGWKCWARPAFVAALVSGLLVYRTTSFRAHDADEFRLVLRGAQDASGLLLVGEGEWGAPGFFYVGRDIPYARFDDASAPGFPPALLDTRINRAVSKGGAGLEDMKAHGFREIATDHNATLLAR